jgi:hypothetical protein
MKMSDTPDMEFNPSNGWIKRFRKRNVLVLRIIRGSYSVNVTEAKVRKTEQ